MLAKKWKIFAQMGEIYERLGKRNGYESQHRFDHQSVQRSRTADRRPYVTLAYERGGTVKKTPKPLVDNEEEEVPIKKQGPYRTKKCGCPFKLKGKQMATSDNWQLFVYDGRHNYKIGVYNYGHA
ncbi:hypothetical protein M9H77_29595 [Catharanthus roseus]|uniref:Uncharacterized protein n=1 Tax=Catharanthus roseus TaxID=4058 RepID=A0ACB9ZUW7_CATRO|nr:hypothetical protein M9H77_29595 [Catharanthus roseus]